MKKVGSREKGKNQVRERREGRELKGRSGRWEGEGKEGHRKRREGTS